MHQATGMHHFALFFVFSLHGFASSDALKVLVQGLQHNFSESEMALVAPMRIDGNRALQASDKGNDVDEERVLSPPKPELLVPLLESVEKGEQGLKKTVDTGVKQKGAVSYILQFAAWFLQPFNEAFISSARKDTYIEQQELLASTPVGEQYDKLMLLGHSPITMKDCFDALDDEIITILPLSERLSELAKLNQLNHFINKFQAAISHGEEGSKEAPPTWQKTYKSLTEPLRLKADSLNRLDEWLIAEDLSIYEIALMHINPINYLILLINKGDIKPPDEGEVIKDIIATAQTAIFMSKAEGKTDAELIARHDRVKKFTLYVEAFERKLLTLKKEIEKALDASVETDEVAASPVIP